MSQNAENAIFFSMWRESISEIHLIMAHAAGFEIVEGKAAVILSSIAFQVPRVFTWICLQMVSIPETEVFRSVI